MKEGLEDVYSIRINPLPELLKPPPFAFLQAFEGMPLPPLNHSGQTLLKYL